MQDITQRAAEFFSRYFTEEEMGFATSFASYDGVEPSSAREFDVFRKFFADLLNDYSFAQAVDLIKQQIAAAGGVRWGNIHWLKILKLNAGMWNENSELLVPFLQHESLHPDEMLNLCYAFVDKKRREQIAKHFDPCFYEEYRYLVDNSRSVFSVDSRGNWVPVKTNADTLKNLFQRDFVHFHYLVSTEGSSFMFQDEFDFFAVLKYYHGVGVVYPYITFNPVTIIAELGNRITIEIQPDILENQRNTKGLISTKMLPICGKIVESPETIDARHLSIAHDDLKHFELYRCGESMMMFPKPDCLIVSWAN